MEMTTPDPSIVLLENGIELTSHFNSRSNLIEVKNATYLLSPFPLFTILNRLLSILHLNQNTLHLHQIDHFDKVVCSGLGVSLNLVSVANIISGRCIPSSRVVTPSVPAAVMFQAH